MKVKFMSKANITIGTVMMIVPSVQLMSGPELTWVLSFC